MDVLLAQNLSSIYLTREAPQTEDILSLPMRSVTLLSKIKPLQKRTAVIWKLCVGQYNCAKADQFLMQSSQSQNVSRDKDIVNFEN